MKSSSLLAAEVVIGWCLLPDRWEAEEKREGRRSKEGMGAIRGDRQEAGRMIEERIGASDQQGKVGKTTLDNGTDSEADNFKDLTEFVPRAVSLFLSLVSIS